MMVSRRARQTLILLTFAGIVGWLILPGLPSSRASAKAGKASGQNQSSGLDAERHALLTKLYAQARAGAGVSQEEADILRRFTAGLQITLLEADVVISRALHAYYISGRELTKEQELLLGRYKSFVARRETDIRDLKTQVRKERQARAAAAAPRAPGVAPPNDQCGGAEVIPGAGPFPYLTAVTDTTEATTGTSDPTVPSCTFFFPPDPQAVSRSIWYSFTPSATANYIISACVGSAGTTVVDTVMGIYTSASGCTGPFTELPQNPPFTNGCSDDDCASGLGLQSVITTQLNAGTTYFIVMSEWGFMTPPTPGETNIQLQISQFLPPPNDTCAGAIALSLNTPVNASTTTGDTPTAANDYDLSAPGCFSGIGQFASTAEGIDVVYSFTAPTADLYSFKVFNYENAFSDLVLYVASSCPTATPPTPVTVTTCLGASNRAFTNEAEEVMCMALTIGQQVFIFVDEDAQTLGSTFTIEVTRCTRESEPNGTSGTAATAAFGIEGSIGSEGDADFYSLGSPAAGSRVFALVDGEAANLSDFDLRVTTATDTLEYDDSNNDVPFGNPSANVGGTPLTGVASFLRVNLNATDLSEPYRLYPVVQPPSASATTEVEPNGTIAEATSGANLYFSGSLPAPTPSTDVDIFSFTASAGDLVFVGLDGDPLRNNTPLDPRLALLDSTGAVLSEVDDSGQTSNTSTSPGTLEGTMPFSPAEGLIYRITQTGTYFVRVTSGPIVNIPQAAGDYLLSISKNGFAGPTAVKLGHQAANQITATRYSDGVIVQWRTAMEVDNLGFNVYREVAGRRVRLNQQLVAGSALMVGPQTSLRSGRSYAWSDPSASFGSRYWIEDVDLNGKTTLHGPIAVNTSKASQPAGESRQASELAQLQGSSALPDAATPVEPKAKLAAVSLSGSAEQAGLAGQATVKITVRESGIYRITQPELAAAGLHPDANPRMLQLFADGREVPIAVTGEKDGRLDPIDSIEFYGLGLDTASTDARVYWLAVGSTPGKRIAQVTAGSNQTGGGVFPFTVELKERTVYFAALRNGEKENFFGAVVARDPIDQAVTLQHVASTSSGDATLEVALQGVTTVRHRVRIDVNGTSFGLLNFDGQALGVTRFRLPQSALKEGHNVVRLMALGGPSDVSLVDYIRITYWHTCTADNDSLRFTAAGKHVVTVDGFSASQVRVFDVTDPNAVQEFAGTIGKGASGFSVSVAVGGSGQRTLLAMTDDRAKRAASVATNRPSSWRTPGQAADLMIITRGDFKDVFEPLKSLRQRQGIGTVVVDVEDVYDEFSYGNRSPQAVKDFLLYAKTNWRIGPRFVLLAGDASYDPKNYLGLGDYDLVPSKLIDTRLMETASDDWFADFDGDALAEMFVGRLPVRTPIEAASAVAKIVGYDQAKRPDGVLLVADVNDGYDFATVNAQLRAAIPQGVGVEEINRGRGDPATVRNDLLKALSRGPRVVNYVGHGSADQWRGNVFTSADARALTNRASLSLFVSMTCLNGYFQDPAFESLGEGLMKSKGGAVAAWASSGMTEPGEQVFMDQHLIRAMFEMTSATAGSRTIGEATARAKAAAADADVRRTWILFGDPTTRLER